MKNATNRLTPEGWHTVTPRIVVRGATPFVKFVKQVFGATGGYSEDRPTQVCMVTQ